jgi:hypothetical protein
VSADDQAYYARRAEEELERAQQALHPKVTQSHYLLTEMYLDRLYGDGCLLAAGSSS